MMTERHEITNRLQRELVRDRGIFGRWQAGTPEQPALCSGECSPPEEVRSRAGHCARPWWWFDPAISGEAMADVGTHLADLALWLIAPDQPVDYRDRHPDARRRPLAAVALRRPVPRVTRLAGYPPELALAVVKGQLYYAGNNSVTFALRGIHVKLTTAWEYEAAAGGGDTHHATAHGTQATAIASATAGPAPGGVRRGHDPADHAEARARRCTTKCDEFAAGVPRVSGRGPGSEVRIVIPDELRTGHESHFARGDGRVRAVLQHAARRPAVGAAEPAWRSTSSRRRRSRWRGRKRPGCVSATNSPAATARAAPSPAARASGSGRSAACA